MGMRDEVGRNEEQGQSRRPAEIVLGHLLAGGVVHFGERKIMMPKPGLFCEEGVLNIGGKDERRLLPVQICLGTFIDMCQELDEGELLACATPPEIRNIGAAVLPRKGHFQ